MKKALLALFLLTIAASASAQTGAYGVVNMTLAHFASATNDPSNLLTVESATLSAPWTFTFPVDGGTNGYVLTTNGSGVASWTSPSSGGTVVSGTAGNLTYYPSSTNSVSGNANANISGGALTLGISTSVIGKLILAGNTTGAVTIAPQAAAGTYEFDLPTSAGSSGQPLLSAGGAGSPMTFGTLSAGAGGSGQSSFATGDILYASSSSALSKLAVGTSAQFLIGGTTPAYASPSIGATLTGNGISTSLGIDLTHANTWTGAQTVGAIINSVNSPTALVANTDNWSVGSANNVLLISASTPVNVTGIVATTAGQVLTLHNTGSNAITFKDASASSTAGNRFILNGDVILTSHGTLTLVYEATDSRWVMLSHN